MGGVEGLMRMSVYIVRWERWDFLVLSACDTRWLRASRINEGLAIRSCHWIYAGFFSWRASRTVGGGTAWFICHMESQLTIIIGRCTLRTGSVYVGIHRWRANRSIMTLQSFWCSICDEDVTCRLCIAIGVTLYRVLFSLSTKPRVTHKRSRKQHCCTTSYTTNQRATGTYKAVANEHIEP
jgi:hypothetical protein